MDGALGLLAGLGREDGSAWSAPSLEAPTKPYYDDHERLLLDPEARNLRHTHAGRTEDGKTLRVAQVWVDPEGKNDWESVFDVDLVASREAGEPRMTLLRVGPIGAR